MRNSISAIIVENEPEDAAALKALLRKAAADICVKQVCSEVADAVCQINLYKPDLIFLDVELDHYQTGFELLQRYDPVPFGVIFTSQHLTFNNAQRAMRASALDYLSKPVELSELDAAIEKYLLKSVTQQTDEFEVLRTNLEQPGGRISEVCIPSTNGHTRINVDNILYCKAEGVATAFHLVKPLVSKPLINAYRDISRDVLLSAKTLKHWEQALSTSDMFRTHRTYLVNMAYAVRYKAKGDGAIFILENGEEIPISRERKAAAKQRWSAYRPHD